MTADLSARPPSLLPSLARVRPAGDGPLLALTVADQAVGKVTPQAAALLRKAGPLFAFGAAGIEMARGLLTPEDRTDAVSSSLRRLAADGDLPAPRYERYPVVTRWGTAELMRIDRSYVGLLGTLAFGLHINGYVPTPAGPEMWIGRRADDRMVEPGKFDNLVGGGQPAGLSLAANLVKEAAEEAGIDAATAARARPAGLIAYEAPHPLGLRRDVLFTFDLELADDFRPVNTDGEVAEFTRHPVADVLDRLRRDPDAFKFNVPAVIIDFCLRHGVLDPDSEPDYAELATTLRQPLD
ncbi:MAG: DUF4743 domain-containing protein [Rhodospirillaceae bacterium]|nr:DUF4743 domain-containing protein [Rhodospirillaceae bacterium]